jgi:hypothetical protein
MRTRTLAALSVVVLASGCSHPGTGPDDTSSKKPRTTTTTEVCGGLLGRTGGRALTQLAHDSKVLPDDGVGAGLHEKVAERMKSASPETLAKKDEPHRACSFLSPPEEDHGEHATITFGWGTEPREVGRVSLLYSAGSALATTDADRTEPARIYYECRTKSGSRGVVEGRLNRYWGGDGMPAKAVEKKLVRVLLASASTMKDALGCTNRPNLSPTAKVKELYAGRPADTTPRWPGLPSSGKAE